MKVLLVIIVLLTLAGLVLWAFFAYVSRFKAARPSPTVAHPTPAAPAAGHGANSHAGGGHHHKPGGLIGFGQGLVWLAVGGFLFIGGGMILMKMWGFDGTAPSLSSHNYDVRFTGRTVASARSLQEPLQRPLQVKWKYQDAPPVGAAPLWIPTVDGRPIEICEPKRDPDCLSPRPIDYRLKYEDSATGQLVDWQATPERINGISLQSATARPAPIKWRDTP